VTAQADRWRDEEATRDQSPEKAEKAEGAQEENGDKGGIERLLRRRGRSPANSANREAIVA
jgi:hypothetical protein